MKKTISLLLALLMSLSLMVFSAGAEGYVPFTDIGDLDEYTQSNIEFLYSWGIMKGTSDTTFSPYSFYTRAMFVTMLGRADGIDPADYPGSYFTDVSASHWAAPYINWASENGIVNGVGDRKFNPDGVITVEQYCAIICRYMDSITASFNYTSTGSWPPPISDLNDSSNYARNSIVTMLETGLLYFEGNTDGVYVFPKDQMTRADIAYNFGDFFYLMVLDEPWVQDMGPAEVTSWVEYG